ncbi:MAG: RidA family protein, partial [Candidatus Udaeobacter sp.]
MNKSFKSERAPEPVGAFPHAKRVGELLFLSGIGPRVRASKEIPG